MSVSPRPPYPAADVLGVRVHLLDLPRTLAAVETLLRDGRPHQIATVNPEFVVRARRDRMFRRVLNTSDLALVDGIGIALALRLLYGIRAWRVTGAAPIRKTGSSSRSRRVCRSPEHSPARPNPPRTRRRRA
jgi:UDP-N-acetyl-D-mannosaminuronic acid transferase (WecB/TagA/CpsF family)